MTAELIRPSDDLSVLRTQDTSIVEEVPLSARQKDRLLSFLDDEVSRAEGDRTEFIRKLTRWEDVYNAPMVEEPKNFPLANSSNLTVPVVKENVNALVAQLSQTTITPSPRWVVVTENEGWSPFTGILERFLDRASKEEIKLDSKLETAITEASKMGTSVLEVGYEERKSKMTIYDRNGKDPRPVHKVVRGPRVYNVPLQDFLIPFDETDINESPWVGKKLRYNPWTLRQKEIDGKFRNVEKVLGAERESSNPENDLGDLDPDLVTEYMEDVEDTEPSLRRQYTVYEIWLRWDLEENGEYAEFLLYYHHDTHTLLSIRYNPFWHHRRPFVVLRYLPVEYRFYGQGLCEQLEALQEEISTIHNQRIDNASIANVRAIKVRRSSGALKPGDPLFTGQIIEVQEMDDLDAFQLGEVYPSTLANEEVTRAYVERLAGTSEAMLGRSMPVTRTTATAQLALLQENAKRFDMTVRKIRESIGELGDLIFNLYFQFGIEEKKPIQWLGERGKVIPAILSLPYEAIDLGLGFQAGAPTSQVNKEAQKQNSIALFNLMVQMYGQIIQLVGPLVGPQGLAPVAASLVQAAKTFMFQTLERFDVTDPDEVLSGLTVLERILPAPEDLGGMESYERRVKELEVLESVGRLEGLLTQGERTDRGD